MPDPTTPGTTLRPSDDPAADHLDVLHPLSAYVRGTLFIQFEGGAAVTRQLSQADARAFLSKQSEAANDDRVTWRTFGWTTWARDHVDYASFEPVADQNWTITAQDRRRLEVAGHSGGVITSLTRYWRNAERTSEPWYSMRVIISLHHLALGGISLSAWESASRRLEGQAGADEVASVWRVAASSAGAGRDAPGDAMADQLDDTAEPEQDQGHTHETDPEPSEQDPTASRE